jgi:chemotaxis-related protein WspB
MLFLSFRLAGQRYAIHTSSVREVLPMVETQMVPDVAPAVIGVFNYHGALIPLVDMRMLAFGQRSEIVGASRIALVDYVTTGGEPHELGILLERDVVLVRRDEKDFVEPPVRTDAMYAGGVALDGADMIHRLVLSNIVPESLWDAIAARQESSEVA